MKLSFNRQTDHGVDIILRMKCNLSSYTRSRNLKEIRNFTNYFSIGTLFLNWKMFPITFIERDFYPKFQIHQLPPK